MTTAITFYGFVLSIHIMAVVVAFGTLFAYPVLLPWARQAHPAAMPVIHDLRDRLRKTVLSPAMGLVLLAGIYLASKADVWSEAWVTVPLVILLLIGGLDGMFFAPRERQLAALSRRDLESGELSAEYDDLFRQVAVAGYAVCGLVLVAIFFMAAKPGA
jgi:uncharacterized membrane protein